MILCFLDGFTNYWSTLNVPLARYKVYGGAWWFDVGGKLDTANRLVEKG